tara:strand:+ start:199 stop:483 length:285 start_codon:yes stop_codon:yes gene_type:complete
MGLFTNLFKYKQGRRYDSAKVRKDNRLNDGYDYENELAPGEFMGKSLSGHIQRNQTMRHFLIFLDDAIKNLLKGARYLHNYKNYTVDQNTKKTR